MENVRDGIRETMDGGEVGVGWWYRVSKAMVRVWAFP